MVVSPLLPVYICICDGQVSMDQEQRKHHESSVDLTSVVGQKGLGTQTVQKCHEMYRPGLQEVAI